MRARVSKVLLILALSSSVEGELHLPRSNAAELSEHKDNEQIMTGGSHHLRKLAKPTSKCGAGNCKLDCVGCADGVECTAICTQYSPTKAPSTKTPTASPIIPPPSIKVAVIGDSLTDEDTSLQVYPPFMRLYLETWGPPTVLFDVRDYAITGSTGCIDGDRSYMNTTVQQCSGCPIVYEQAKMFHPDNPPTQPDLAIVMLGANDSKDGNWNVKNCNARFEADMQYLFGSLTNLGTTVFASYAPAVDRSSPCCGINDTVVQLQQPMINNAAVATGSIVLDTHAFTENHTDSSGCGSTEPCWYTDGVHFNAVGAEALAGFFGCYVLELHFNGTSNGCVCNFDGICDSGEECGKCQDCGACPTDLPTKNPTNPPCDCKSQGATNRGSCKSACGGGVCTWAANTCNN